MLILAIVVALIPQADNETSEPYMTYSDLDSQSETVSDSNTDSNSNDSLAVDNDASQEKIYDETNSSEYSDVVAKQEYILPNSDSQYLTMTDLEGLTAEQCILEMLF